MSKPVRTPAGLVTVSGHAIDRYVERVKPAYTPKHAHWELARILPQAEVLQEMPEWANNKAGDKHQHYETDCFLLLCDSLLFPVFGVLGDTGVGPVQCGQQRRGGRRPYAHTAIGNFNGRWHVYRRRV